MSVYERAGSPYWWMYIPSAPKAQRRHSTKILKGVTATERKQSRALADTLFHARSLTASGVKHGLPVQAEAGEDAGPTFDHELTWYETHVLPRNKGAERERGLIPRLRAAFGHVHLDDPTWVAQVIAYRTNRLARGTVIKHFGGPKGKRRVLKPPGPRTVNREVDVLQQVMSASVEAKRIAASPLYGLPDLKFVDPIRRTMSEAEEIALAGELSPEDYAIFCVGLDGLVRLTDILDLKRADDHGTTLDIREPKNGDPITVQISTRLRAALDAVPVDPASPEWYFPGRRGAETERDRRGGYAKALKRACGRANVPYGRAQRGLTFHWATRRTGATRMIRQGGEKAIGVVQKIGGWKDATVLIGIYQETITPEMVAAVETVAPAALMPKTPATVTTLQLVGGKTRPRRAHSVHTRAVTTRKA
jgi:integrase